MTIFQVFKLQVGLNIGKFLPGTLFISEFTNLIENYNNKISLVKLHAVRKYCYF